MNRSASKSNTEIVLEVLGRAFNKHDATVAGDYFGADYVQHNPAIPSGPSAIASMIPTLTRLRYELGMAVASGDLVMVQGRERHVHHADRIGAP